MLARVHATIPFGAAHNNCYLCNGGQRTRADGRLDRFIDTGIVIEFEGGLVMCETCVTFLGKRLGLLTPEDVESLTRELVEVVDARVAAELRIVELERKIEALRVIAGEQLADEALADALPPAPPQEETLELRYEAYAAEHPNAEPGWQPAAVEDHRPAEPVQ